VSRSTSRMILTICAGLLFLAAAPAFAQSTVTISFDENCTGLFENSNGSSFSLDCGPLNDPGPGGLSNALFYNMLNPPGLVAGDVFILEPNSQILSDILRFDPNVQGGGVFVYSGLGGDLADTGFPSDHNQNSVTVFEVGFGKGGQGVSYTPVDGQPGFVALSAGPVTYNLASDSEVPEPATGLLLLAPLAAFALRRGKRTA
jgi:hypothetical protein